MNLSDPFHEDTLKNIGNNLYAIRNSKREKMDALAATLNISQTTISKIENGRYPALKIDMLCSIAGHYNMEVADFLKPYKQ